MGPIEDILAAISQAGKVITDASNWTLTVEDPYQDGTQGPQLAASVDTVTTPGDHNLQIAFTFNGTQYTMLAESGGNDAAISINGTSEPDAHMVVVPLADPIHMDIRPVTLPGVANTVRLNFRFSVGI